MSKKIVEKDWRYHLKSAVDTFLTFFIPMLIVQIEGTDFTVEKAEVAILIGIGGAVIRAVIKAGTEALKPAILSLLKKR